jgi:hypothetical protein
MDRAFLEGLGLKVTEGDDQVVEAELELTSGRALNPLTRHVISTVSFSVMGDRLLYVGPPEFVGAWPINLAFLTNESRLEDLAVQTLNDHLYQLERRTNELSALGISAKVDPSSLELSAELERGAFRFTLSASRTGQFRVSKCVNEGTDLPIGDSAVFELTEFRDRGALEDFLYAMFGETTGASVPSPREKSDLSAQVDVKISVKELFEAFGDTAVPPRSTMEFFAEVRVGGETLRFAAARLQGRTFRGLLAGPAGKIWAERFELNDFPGVRGLVSELVGVPIDDIEVVE